MDANFCLRRRIRTNASGCDENKQAPVCPERHWAESNPLVGKTREMGPGARHDVLDDAFDDWNRWKVAKEEAIAQGSEGISDKNEEKTT
jgi:hypothetical protein